VTKQTVIVDDKAGATAFIAAQFVAEPRPMATRCSSPEYDPCGERAPLQIAALQPVKDFRPVTLQGGGQILIVNPKVPAKSVQELIAYAKANPGKVSFGWGSSSSRIAGELFQQMAGVQLLSVPYKSNPTAVTDLLGGQIDMMITDNATGLPQVKGGKVRALGMSSLKRSPLAPDVPTIDEAGVKGYEMSYWFRRRRHQPSWASCIACGPRRAPPPAVPRPRVRRC
jgi:tripartite-type tricarboxylate transporter receptor subunit TctC